MQVAPAGLSGSGHSGFTVQSRQYRFYNGDLNPLVSDLIERRTTFSNTLIQGRYLEFARSTLDLPENSVLNPIQVRGVIDLLRRELFDSESDRGRMSKIFDQLKEIIFTVGSKITFSEFIVEQYCDFSRALTDSPGINTLLNKIVGLCERDPDFSKCVRLRLLVLYPGTTLQDFPEMKLLFERLPAEGMLDRVSSHIRSVSYHHPIKYALWMVGIAFGTGLLPYVLDKLTQDPEQPCWDGVTPSPLA